MSWRDAWEPTAYVVILDPDEGGRNRRRVRIRAERRTVARYDTAHGYAHEDRLDRAGRNLMEVYLGNQYRFGAILDGVVARIRADWRTFLAAFPGDWQ
jgi:hypothetical protein